jgi:hypothetical protein
MAKKHVESPADAPPASDPVAHKDPTDRAHIWERPARADEIARTEALVDYPHELPRHVHRANGAYKLVTTPDECETALAEGWSLTPTPPAA